jgi:hypothetical protein
MAGLANITKHLLRGNIDLMFELNYFLALVVGYIDTRLIVTASSTFLREMLIIYICVVFFMFEHSISKIGLIGQKLFHRNENGSKTLCC